MNVSELITFLKTLPEDMEVLYENYSDYGILEPKDIEVAKAVPQNSYVMRSHPTMSAENKLKEKLFVILPGN